MGHVLVGEEKLEFTHRLLVLGNIALLIWVFAAFFGVLYYTLIYSWLYLILEAVVIYAILRRLGCSSCYRCKACTSGFGRLAGAFFGSGHVKKESVGNRIGLVIFAYVLLLAVPVALTALSLTQAFTTLKVAVLVCLLLLGGYSLTTWYRRPTVQP